MKKNSSSSKPSAAPETKRGASESRQSIETFPQRTKRPGEAGLANEARPGLGTRADMADPKVAGKVDPKAKISAGDAREGEPPSPPERRPAPSEQDSNSFAQQEERDTGVSGHSGGT
jgi:hypothetical protein